MCLGTIQVLEEAWEDDGARVGRLADGSVVSLGFVPGCRTPASYVIVHLGVPVEVLEPKDAAGGARPARRSASHEPPSDRNRTRVRDGVHQRRLDLGELARGRRASETQPCTRRRRTRVAGLVLLSLALPLRYPRASHARSPARRRQWPDCSRSRRSGGAFRSSSSSKGLARAEATQAAFIQKTLGRLGRADRRSALERSGSAPPTSPRSPSSSPARRCSPATPARSSFGTGEAMILAATLLWAVEVDPREAPARFDRGANARRRTHGRSARVMLVCWVALSGRGGELVHLTADQWSWAILTGLFLSAYVATWYGALARAQAVDVTAVLVFGAVVTAVLSRATDGVAFDALGRRPRVDRRRARRRRGTAFADAHGMTPGPLLFARYAYPPNALGLCGAEESRTLLEYGTAGASDEGLAELARAFEGAWPYLTLIAGANKIRDPLDPRVVEAYWVGNSLLDRVSPQTLARHVEDRFKGRVGRSWERIVDAVAAGAVPHHTFHVFAVYPWLGLLRTGAVDAAAVGARSLPHRTRSRRGGRR